VPTADVVLENFRPGTMAQMGFGYDQLRALKPDIILTSVSGFGQYGPYRERPAFDPLGQAMSGLMSLTGAPFGTPLGAATSLVDRYTSLHATIGTLAALHHRDRTGEGQLVDCCLMDSALTMVEIPTSYYLATGEEGGEAGRPPFKAKDGHVVISASGSAMATRLMQIATGNKEAAAEGWTSRVGRGDARRKAVEAWCAENTVDHIVKTLLDAEIPVAPVKTIPQVAVDPLSGSARCWSRWKIRWPAKCTSPARRSRCPRPPAGSAPSRPRASTPTRCSPGSSAMTAPPWRSYGRRR